MKTPSSSGKKKKKKISGVSPSMDLTRFGFSVKKRSSLSSPASSPPKSASVKRNSNAGANNDNENLESPLKRRKVVSSPTVKNDGQGSSKLATPTKKPAPATKSTDTTAATVLDLTQSSSSEDAPSNKKEGITGLGNNAAAKNTDRAKEDDSVASLGGLASSIASQIVSASSHKQQQQQQPMKQRRGKRDKAIIPNNAKAAVTTKSVEQTSNSHSSNAITTTAKSSSSSLAVAKSLSPSKKKGGNNIQALALVRVINPHEITCSTAVANARHPDQPQRPKQQQQSWTPRRIFNGAILGRSSTSANAKSNFVDLGISNMCRGVSRNHITVLNVRVKSDNTTTVMADELSPTKHTLSQTSAASSSTKNSTSSIQSDQQSTITLQVSDNASNGVTVHRTRRGSRKVAFLSKGEKMTLRLGDAIEFYSNEKLYYCVVGLESLEQGGTKVQQQHDAVARQVEMEKEVVAVVEDEKRVAAAKTAMKKRISSGTGVNSGGKKATPAILNLTDEGNIVDAKKDSRTGASKTALKTPRNGTTLSNVKSAPSVEEVVDTPRLTPAATSPTTSRVKSATKTTVAKRLDKKLQKSPMGPKSPNKSTFGDGDKADVAIDPTVDVVESSKTLAEEQDVDEAESGESEMIKKGDLVKARFGVKDWFDESQLEWYFGTVLRVKKNKKSSSKQAYEIDVLYADEEKDTLPFPDDDVEKADGHEYPDSFFVGDSVDCLHQDGLRPGHEGRWYRGRISSISEDGSSCDVLYIDGDVSSFNRDATLVK